MDPDATRPFMPGYGIVGPDEGSGLLEWAWAVARLTSSHDYWVATSHPDGQPNVMPVWGAWLDTAVWLSSSHESRRSRNLRVRPRCTVTTDSPLEPVVVEGTAEFITDPDAVETFVDTVNAKYATSYPLEFFNSNAVIVVRPVVVFGIDSADFTGSPTRWKFGSRRPD